MRRLLINVSVMLALSACGKKDEGKATSTTTGAAATSEAANTVAAPTPAPTEAKPSVEVSPEMKDFLAMLDGTEGSSAKALKKHGATAVQKNDLGMYALKDPKVTKAEKLGVLQCYTFEATAGTAKHQTRTCWDSSGKIAQVTDKTL